MTYDGSGDVDQAAYRQAMGRFLTGITVVTTVDAGVVHAMTVNSITSVSLEPLLLLFCAEKAARFHDAVMSSKQFAVSILAAEHGDAARWLATRGRPVENQLAGFAVSPGPLTQAPVFDDALATIECRTWSTADGGDHTIVIGEVVGVNVPRPDGDALVYYEGDFHAVPLAGD